MTRTPNTLGIVTGDSVPELTDDGTQLCAALRERGFEAAPVVWSDRSVEWSRFDALVVRSCWQYYERPSAFREWIRTVGEAGVQLVNPPEVLRWNAHKFYLRDLEDAGVDVLPTAYVPRNGDAKLEAILEERNWKEAVVKPAVGTSSHDVWRLSAPPTATERERFRAALAEGDLLVQAFAPEINEGELSCVFFGGEYSHATRSIPAADDFRGGPEHGNTLESADPSESVVSRCQSAVSTAAEHCGIEIEEIVYARVDGLRVDGAFRLMELELIEPYLNLGRDDGRVERFADAIESALPSR